MRHLARLLQRFVADQQGQALIMMTVMLPALVGFSLLAIDMARVNNLHNDLQRAADAFALAAAAELDGRSDAEIRAARAIANLVQNQHRFSDLGTYTLTSADIAWRFLEDLPTNDADEITEAYESESAEESWLIEVTIAPTNFTSIFPASFLGGTDTMTVGATAVAGFTGTVVCGMTPLFICNPFEGMTVDGVPVEFHDIVNDENFYGRGLRLVSNDGGSNGAWGPGNFGFLRPTDAHGYGAQDLASDIARSHLRECVTTRGIHFRTGGPQPAVRDAINVRFDIYGGSFSQSDATIPPAPNVRKGYEFKNKNNPNACNMDPADDYSQYGYLTQDESYPDLGGKLGNGAWSYLDYVAAAGYSEADMAGFVDGDGNPYDDANPPSRYDLYIYEIENGLTARSSPGGETGIAGCHSAPSTDPNRRLIYGALVNCSEHADDLNGQSGDPVPAVGYASFFLTEPVSQARTGGDIMAEIVDIDGIKGRGTMENFARDDVQLFR